MNASHTQTTDKPATMKRPKSAGNSNAVRHGLKAAKLPKDAKYVEHQLNRLRRELEAAVVDAKGEVSLTDASIILTAVAWQRHGALSQRWLRIKGDDLKPEQLIAFSREIAKASSERDRAIAALELNAKRDTDWGVVDNGDATDETEQGS
jgi:hypothetical protein